MDLAYRKSVKLAFIHEFGSEIYYHFNMTPILIPSPRNYYTFKCHNFHPKTAHVQWQHVGIFVFDEFNVVRLPWQPKYQEVTPTPKIIIFDQNVYIRLTSLIIIA